MGSQPTYLLTPTQHTYECHYVEGTSGPEILPALVTLWYW